MTEELEPCPAGHAVVTIVTAPHKEPMAFIRRHWQLEHAYGYCAECGWKGPLRNTVEEAAAAWNTRAESADSALYGDLKTAQDVLQEFDGEKVYQQAQVAVAEVERLREENKRLSKQFGGTMEAILWMLSRSRMADSKEADEIRKFRNELAQLPEKL